MNKKLLGLAVAAAFAVPMVAQADSGNVVIYGQANASVDNVNTGVSGQDKYWQVSSNSSRLGFKGSEDLGGGLSAVFQMETLVQLDALNGSATAQPTGGNAFMGRNTFVGLSSKTMGTALLGKHDTPYKLGTGSLDVFADTMGDYNSIVGSLNGTLAFDSRLGNVMAYISPTWSGFHFAAATVTANEGGNTGTANPTAYSATAVYANGPLFASLSYEKASDTVAATAATTLGTNLPALATGFSANSVKLGLGYNYGAGNINFVYENSGGNALENTALDRSAFYLAGTYKMGATTLKAAFAKANDGASAADSAAKQYTLGASYDMSKRTSVYALYTKMVNASGASYGLGGNGIGNAVAAAADIDPSAISLGMKHAF